jgi:broad specificity phosphatase PhoE
MGCVYFVRHGQTVWNVENKITPLFSSYPCRRYRAAHIGNHRYSGKDGAAA